MRATANILSALFGLFWAIAAYEAIALLWAQHPWWAAIYCFASIGCVYNCFAQIPKNNRVKRS